MIELLGVTVAVIALLYMAFIGQKSLKEWWKDRRISKLYRNNDKRINSIYQNLPQPHYVRLIGRDKEINKILDLLKIHGESRFYVVAIDGLGGIGKSALALEVAYRLFEQSKRKDLPDSEKYDAIIWISAKQKILIGEGIINRPVFLNVVDDIYSCISVTLGHEDITRAKPEEQVELVKKILTQYRTLIILDNLETIDDQRIISFILEVPGPTRIIVTSRHQIGIGHPIRLTGMSKEDAISLINEECIEKNVQLDHQTKEKIFEVTSGVPLAIVWTIAQISFGKNHEFVVKELEKPTSEISQFCFESSVNIIRGSKAHELIMAMSLFPSGATRETLGYILDFNEDPLSRDDALYQLKRLSLIDFEDHRFKMLPLTKSFVLGEISKNHNFLSEIQRKYINFFCELIQKNIGLGYWDGRDALDSWACFGIITKEIENILSAIDMAVNLKDWRATRDLIIGIIHILWAMDLWKLRIPLSQQAITAVQNLGIKEDEGWLKVDALGFIYIAQGEYEEALKNIDAGYLIASEINSNDIIVLANCFKARINLRLHKYDEAERILKQASGFSCSTRIHKRLQNTFKYIELFRKEASKERMLETGLLKSRRELNELTIKAYELLKSAERKRKKGKINEAKLDIEEAYRLEGDIGDMKLRANIKLQKGLLEIQLGKIKEGRQTLKDTQDIFEYLQLNNEVSKINKIFLSPDSS